MASLKNIISDGGLTELISKVKTALNGKSDTTHTHSLATASANGLMSSTDKIKLDSISTPNTYSITLSSSDWSSSAPYTQTVTVSGVTSAIKLLGMLDTRDCSSEDDEKAMKKAYGYLTYFETGENIITATAKFDKPAVDVTIAFRGA